jgi:AcrR family transcriptional regulator
MPSVTRRPAGPDRRTGVEAKILETTERLLAGGARFTELGVQRIAAEAGVARSTFYVYFRDKTELLLKLIHTLADGAYHLVGSATPDQGLEGMVGAMLRDVRYYRERRHLLAAALEVAAYDTAVRDFWDGQLQRFIELAEGWLRAEQAAGRAAADLAPSTAARVFVLGGFQVLADQVLNGPEDQDEVVAREIAMLEWYGAFRRPSQS